ncbi:MAG: hypothetical protein IJ049_00895 [Oscillospiraceae bacterium]|nr:hypothetical protein [Oscillospiraceae bacterium]
MENQKHLTLRIATVLLCLTLATSYALSGSLARFIRSDSSDERTATVALFGHSEEFSLSDLQIKPGDVGESAIVVPITITNQSDGKISEVAQSYTIEIKTTDNLSLQYTLTENDEPLTSDDSVTDSYFYQSEDWVFEAGVAGTKEYNLIVEWPSGSATAEDSLKLEDITININVTQID